MPQGLDRALFSVRSKALLLQTVGRELRLRVVATPRRVGARRLME